MAGSFENERTLKKNFLNKLMPYGNLFFLYPMASFGDSHIVHATYMLAQAPSVQPNRVLTVWKTVFLVSIYI